MVRKVYEPIVSHTNRQKFYRFEIDQSIKVEETGRNTIIAMANEEFACAATLTKETKRVLRESARTSGAKPQLHNVHVFARAIVALLLQTKDKVLVHELLIDEEYTGYEKQIRRIIVDAFPEIAVYFGRVGKLSPAHQAAYGVHRGRRESDGGLEHEFLQPVVIFQFSDFFQ